MKKRVLFFLLLVFVLVLCVACATPDGSTEPSDSEAPDTSTSTGTSETLADSSTEPDGPPTPEEIKANKYASAGLELTLKVCEQYYDLKKHSLATSLTNRNTTTVWPLAAFIEMLAEAHRMFPEDKTVLKYYTDALDYALAKHLVTNATITPPGGKTFTGISYYNAGPNWKGDFYYDDNAWICIQLLDAYKQLGKQKYLTLAEKVLEFMWTGWDETYGGVYWDKTFSGKGICSNGPVCVSYLAAYEITGKAEYLERAKMIYEWCNRMLRNTRGLYNAGIKNIKKTEYDANNLDPWIAAYDQGTMMTSAAMLYKITGEQSYFDELSKTVQSSVSFLFEGTDKMKGNPIFKSWCIGWIVRGEMTAYATDCTTHSKRFMRNMKNVLDKVLKTKDDNGHYDPFFLSGEWWPPADDPDADYFDHDAMQPSGVATVLLLTAHYQLFQAE